MNRSTRRALAETEGSCKMLAQSKTPGTKPPHWGKYEIHWLKVLHGNELVVYECLNWHANAESRLAWPSPEAMIDECNLCRSSVYNALAKLIKRGKIERLDKPGYRYPQYRLYDPGKVERSDNHSPEFKTNNSEFLDQRSPACKTGESKLLENESQKPDAIYGIEQNHEQTKEQNQMEHGGGADCSAYVHPVEANASPEFTYDCPRTNEVAAGDLKDDDCGERRIGDTSRPYPPSSPAPPSHESKNVKFENVRRSPTLQDDETHSKPFDPKLKKRYGQLYALSEHLAQHLQRHVKGLCFPAAMEAWDRMLADRGSYDAVRDIIDESMKPENRAKMLEKVKTITACSIEVWAAYNMPIEAEKSEDERRAYNMLKEMEKK